jgi:hypothetical protein
MAQQTRRAPGRPKAQPKEVEASTIVEQAPVAKAKPKAPPIKRVEEQENKTVEYKVIKGGGIVYMLPQQGITVFDKETKAVRELRYCPNENSIWSDEQGAKAMKKSVIFRNGRIFVRPDQPNLLKFLQLHPGNVANGGSEFKEVNKKFDAEKQLQSEFLVTDAITMVRDKDITDLLAVALYFKVNINAPTSEIRHNLLRIAKNKPKEFIESFDSPTVRTRAIIKQAADYQIISLKKDSCRWFDSNSMIVSVPVGQDPTDVLCRFCLTEKGSSVLADIEDRLERLA